mgnify:CR=1 FL=1
MRLFLCTFAKIYHYESLQTELNKYFLGKWTSNKNLHLTFKFLGNVTNTKSIFEELKDFSYKKNKRIIFNEMKLFEGRKKVLYLGTSSSEINDIQKELSKRLDFLHIDSKEFVPHLTLLKIKTVLDENYEDVFKSYKNKILAESFLKIFLMKSTRTQEGAKYDFIKEF